MAKLHRKIRLLECARGGVFGGVAEGGGNPGFGGFWESRVVGVVVAFHKKWPEENWFCQNRPYCGRTKPRVRKQIGEYVDKNYNRYNVDN